MRTKSYPICDGKHLFDDPRSVAASKKTMVLVHISKTIDNGYIFLIFIINNSKPKINVPFRIFTIFGKFYLPTSVDRSGKTVGPISIPRIAG